MEDYTCKKKPEYPEISEELVEAFKNEFNAQRKKIYCNPLVVFDFEDPPFITIKVTWNMSASILKDRLIRYFHVPLEKEGLKELVSINIGLLNEEFEYEVTEKFGKDKFLEVIK